MGLEFLFGCGSRKKFGASKSIPVQEKKIALNLEQATRITCVLWLFLYQTKLGARTRQNDFVMLRFEY